MLIFKKQTIYLLSWIEKKKKKKKKKPPISLYISYVVDVMYKRLKADPLALKFLSYNYINSYVDSSKINITYIYHPSRDLLHPLCFVYAAHIHKKKQSTTAVSYLLGFTWNSNEYDGS